MVERRTRRSAEESRALILESAAGLLVEGGVQAVQVRAVASLVGITDAGVSHHFGTRDRLLEALLRHGGRRLRDELAEVLAHWLDQAADVGALVEALAGFYREGYAELALSLHDAGWRDGSSGLLDPVVDALHSRRSAASSKDDTRLAVAALHQALALESVYGSTFRRSAGIAADGATDAAGQLRWWTAAIEKMLDDPG